MCQSKSVYGLGIVLEMSLETGIKRGTMELKVPCSTTELLAQALPRVYSKTTLSSTWGPPLMRLAEVLTFFESRIRP